MALATAFIILLTSFNKTRPISSFLGKPEGGHTHTQLANYMYTLELTVILDISCFQTDEVDS